MTETLRQASQWLVDMTHTFDAWPTTLLIAAALILVAVTGVTGRCAAGDAGAVRQTLLIILTTILTIALFAILWVIANRILPSDAIAWITRLLELTAPAGLNVNGIQ